MPAVGIVTIGGEFSAFSHRLPDKFPAPGRIDQARLEPESATSVQATDAALS